MLHTVKLRLLASANRLGITALVANSAWRRQRLLILCYHGISLRDEHVWNPGLYMDRRRFESRMEHLRTARCHVLSLGEGLDRLRRGELPERSVAVTFDDGWHDFHQVAMPILSRFEIPATVYLTTYYVGYNRPVFDTMLRYLLWSARGRALRLASVIPITTPVPDPVAAIENHVRRASLGAAAKDELLAAVAKDLEIDYRALLEQRVLHLMNAGEVKAAAQAGIDIQLHTHRHRVSRDASQFAREILENRDKIRSITGLKPDHFCYPGGNFLPQYDSWLNDLEVVSATTCEARLCQTRDNLRFLPRILDSERMTQAEFEAWVAGLREWLPRRRYAPAEGQFLEDWMAPS